MPVKMPGDPFGELGLDRGADADAVRAARRLLAREHHPDRGGDAERMQRINEAADAALLTIERDLRTQQSEDSEVAPTSPPSPTAGAGPPDANDVRSDEQRSRFARDMPSFTVEALPVETFEALLIVTSWMGEVLDDDPPYRLDAYLSEPFDCWCRLDVVPDAGASTVSITIAGVDGAPTPDLVAVRDAWVANLNVVDWE